MKVLWQYEGERTTETHFSVKYPLKLFSYAFTHTHKAFKIDHSAFQTMHALADILATSLFMYLGKQEISR